MQNHHDHRFLAADRIRQLQQEALSDHLLDDCLHDLLRTVWLNVRRAWPWRSGRASESQSTTAAGCAGPTICDC